MTKKLALILTPFFSPNIGGVESHFDDLLKALDRQDWPSLTLTYSPLTTPDVEWKAVEHRGSAEIRRYRWFGNGLFHKVENFPLADFLYLTPYLGLRTLLTFLKHRKQIGVVHAQGFNAGLIGVVLKRLFGVRLIISTHAVYEIDPTSKTAQQIKSILEQADKVLCLSNASLEELKSFGVPSTKLDRFRYWIDLERFSPLDQTKLRAEIGVPDRFSVLFVGRLIEKKGISQLLGVAQRLPHINFLFVGVGPEEDRIRQAEASHKNVIFLGKQANDQLHRFYNLADIFCIPSQYEEGFGRVVLEAIACGVPVVGSNRGGLSEALSSEVACLVDPTVDNLTREIQRLAEDPQAYQSLKQATREFAVSQYSEANLELITKHYQ